VLEIKLQISLEFCMVPKIKVLEVKLHMSLDASQMLYGIHDYPPSGLD
jgi:hypothetical protein